MSIKDKIRKILLSLGVVVLAGTAVAFTSPQQQYDDAFENDPVASATQDPAQEAKQQAIKQKRKELNSLSEYQTKFSGAVFNLLFINHLAEIGFENPRSSPAIIDGAPCLVTLKYPYRRLNPIYFETSEIYKLESNEENLLLFENLSVINNYSFNDDAGITLNQAKDALAELAYFFNIEKSDITKLLIKSKNSDAMLDYGYNLFKPYVPDFLEGAETLPNVTGSIVVNDLENAHEAIIYYLANNYNNLEPVKPPVEAELEQ